MEIHPNWNYANVGTAPAPTMLSGDSTWFARTTRCPACSRLVIELGAGPGNANSAHYFHAWPMTGHVAVPPDVPEPYATDFRESSVVLQLSPKASAAVSRRLLQMLLVDKGGARKKDLVHQIDEVKPSLPPYIVTTLDTVRVVGNYAAHPMKDTNTGAVLSVEPGEAELTLEAVHELLRFYFTDPAASAKKLASIQAKLDAAGKPKLKTS